MCSSDLLRKAVRKGSTTVVSVASYASSGTAKLQATHIACTPNGTAGALSALPADVVAGLSAAGAVIMVGQRAAATPGLLSAVCALSAQTGARIAWVPRRAGERGALEVGAASGLLPGGRSAADANDRATVEAVWGALPGQTRAAGDDLVGAVARGEFAALITAGIEPRDAADPQALRSAVAAAGFVVAFETRHTEITERADVVFPVAVVTEKSGRFVNWEGRVQAFAAVEPGSLQLSDARVLADLAEAMGVPFPATATAVRRELTALAVDAPPSAPAPATATTPATSGVVLDTWHELIDAGALSEGEPYLGATARPVLARMSAATAAAASIVDGGQARVAGARGEVIVDACVEPGMADGVVWLPANARGCCPADSLGARIGDAVSLSAGGAQ